MSNYSDKHIPKTTFTRIVAIAAWILVSATSGLAESGVVFEDIAAGGGAGLIYQRTESESILAFEQWLARFCHGPVGLGCRRSGTELDHSRR